MMSTPSNRKRLPTHLPTPSDIARLFKKHRPEHPELLETNACQEVPDMSPMPSAQLDPPSIAHSVPYNAMPILDSPYKVSDFFSDYEAKLSKAQSDQLARSVKCNPPPMAPFLTAGEAQLVSKPGIMIPFVFPPLPTIQYDQLTNMPESLSDQPDDTRPTNPVMAPLPFPPANFMPYPLVSEMAPPTPHEVFGKWIDASEHLPRIDMVVASAAGTMYDFHTEAEAAGLSATKLQEIVRLGQLVDSDPEALDDKSDFSDSSDASESSYRHFMDYYEGINISNTEDAYAKEPLPDALIVESATRNVIVDVAQPVLSKRSVEDTAHKQHTSAFVMTKEEINQSEAGSPPTFSSDEEVVDSTGADKSPRREHLMEIHNKLESHFEKNRDQIFASRKRELLERLDQLQSSKVYFDRKRDQINNEELKRYAYRKQAQTDEQLSSLQLSSNYEKLKMVLNFYQTSYRSYKTMNQVMINKLQKVKNFLEYQKQLLDEHSGAKGSNDGEVISIRNRDISKLYEVYAEQDYSNEIKEIFRAANAKDDGLEKEDPYTLNPALFKKVYIGYQHHANVQDFMPLVTKEEFKLVTGEAPSKLGPAKDHNSKGKGGRHHIFQSTLYDRPTSGSDTNASDPAVPLKRRPGRRAAPKATYGEDVAKNNNDTALVAKIMKQFIGPAAANAQELTEDLDLIGIDSKWPVR